MPDDQPSKDSVPPDDDTAQTPLGVGESINKRGEDVTDKDDPDSREDAQSDRTPAAAPAAERTGINPQDPPDRT